MFSFTLRPPTGLDELEDYLELVSGGRRLLFHQNYHFDDFVTVRTQSGEVATKDSFIRACSILLTRPDATNKKVYSTETELKLLIPNASLPLAATEELREELSPVIIHPFNGRDLQFIDIDCVSSAISVRTSVLNDGETCDVFEFWDLCKPCIKVFQLERAFEGRTNLNPSVCTLFVQLEYKSLPGTLGGKGIATLTLRSPPEPYEGIDKDWVEEYVQKIFPKFLSWANLDVPDVLGPIPTRSLILINNRFYHIHYNAMKTKYMASLNQIWKDGQVRTNPQKFIPEDLGTAAYINNLRREKDWVKHFFEFGCGNGVLTYLLRNEGWEGSGVDIRKRAVWDFLPNMESSIKVGDLSKDETFPFSDYFKAGTVVIGNHPDELTLWVPFTAARYKTNFILIPCCPYGILGKFEKVGFNDEEFKKTSSIYENYIRYLLKVSRLLGFECELDRLRIPSTKRVAIIGTYRGSSIMEPDDAQFMRELCAEIILARERGSPGVVEKAMEVRNCTSLPREKVTAAISKIFHMLLQVRNEIFFPEKGVMWNQGNKSMSLKELVEQVGPETLLLVKNQNKGLQTLIRNHGNIFKIQEGKVGLLIPTACDPETLKKNNKYKKSMCYFDGNHPNGCPLRAEECRFRHKSETADSTEHDTVKSMIEMKL